MLDIKIYLYYLTNKPDEPANRPQGQLTHSKEKQNEKIHSIRDRSTP